ncbi:NAD(P)-binding protein [Sphingosinicella rhizophila]|uniref:NAD(P)-binding protein n=1 Tax=Sphingosinicella rhizophila TaxID=3050082 RepID=A0ABU3Q8M9_9SPHN|nr:NAD(P)-binding protein [Sphingosinicella sp. GR2756]MDT9599763.1 NAD(P)-binding protein [Sphingosinicella sp. GR2756]
MAESYDVVVVGGGFSGISALYELSKQSKASQRYLLLENHAIFGGEAKQNEFEVDGQRLVAPQGSNSGAIIQPDFARGVYGGGRYDVYADYWRELDMPSEFPLEPLAGGAERYEIANDHYDPMVRESRYDVGYWFKGHGWVKNPMVDDFARTPWPIETQRSLSDFVANRRDAITGRQDVDEWLDGMTYGALLERLGYGLEARRYIDPFIAVSNFGVCGDAISAFAAKRLGLPGTIPSGEKSRFATRNPISFPGGNAAILRTMLSRIIPDAFIGGRSKPPVMEGQVNFGALDREDARVRIRLRATVTRVANVGNPERSEHAELIYVRDGRLAKIRARAVVMATGGWVNRRVVADLPDQIRDAYGRFNYGPILTANVAIRNWRFFDKLGFTVARWFEGLGWHVCVRRNVANGADARPLTPDSPIVLTFYIPFLHPGADPASQGALGRQQLLETSYAIFEQQLRTCMTEMFGAAGFDARRDIAGIVLNRWGHAYLAPPPGFFFNKDAGGTVSDIIRMGHGRIIFAHSDLQGNMSMAHAMREGKRGALTAASML